jgi:hypothetical protein
VTRPRHAHERRLHWVAFAIGESGQGYGHCGDVGHRHEVDEDAYACPWWPALEPSEPFSVYVREVLLERGQLRLGGIR